MLGLVTSDTGSIHIILAREEYLSTILASYAKRISEYQFCYWGRMAKGKRIPDPVDELIVHTHLLHPDWMVKEVQKHVVDQLRELTGPDPWNGIRAQDVKDGNWPGISAIDKRLRKYRERETEDDPLQAAWSLGVSTRFNIPPDANADLLRIWWWCLVVGRTFTIREAAWVAKLRGTVPPRGLLKEACTYALRERACELLNKGKTYTHDLDLQLAFLRVVRDPFYAVSRAARSTGIIPEPAIEQVRDLVSSQEVEAGREPNLESLPRWQQGALAEQVVRSVTREVNFAWLAVPAGTAVEYSLGFICEHSLEVSDDADMVYALWLRYLSKGSKWNNLSQVGKERIAQRLHEEVAAATQKMRGWREDETKDWLERAVGFDWKPSKELFSEVGVARVTQGEGGGTTARIKGKQG